MPLPLKSDPALTAEVNWLERSREQMARANAAWPEIIAELRASGALRPMKRGPFTPLDPDREYVPGFEEDWTIG